MNRAPRQTGKGDPGEVLDLRLELKLLADVGLVGLPNAGKSSLIRQLSHATPKVADYPFTTLRPHLGIVEVGAYSQFVMADIPGLIKGAADGAGLGLRFLKHISRCEVLLHLVDPIDDEKSVIERIQEINHELESYGHDCLEKEQIVVVTKMDCLAEDQRDACIQEIKSQLDAQKVFKNRKIDVVGVSAQEQFGLERLKSLIIGKLPHIDE